MIPTTEENQGVYLCAIGHFINSLIERRVGL